MGLVILPLYILLGFTILAFVFSHNTKGQEKLAIVYLILLF